MVIPDEPPATELPAPGPDVPDEVVSTVAALEGALVLVSPWLWLPM